MLQVEIKGLDELNVVIDTLANGDYVKGLLSEQIQKFGQINKQRYDYVSATTPYAQSYYGRFKPSKLRRAGGTGDLGFGKDTLALYSDLLFTWTADRDTLINYSDLAYAGRINELVEAKQGQGLYAEDSLYLDALEVAVSNRIEEIWAS